MWSIATGPWPGARGGAILDELPRNEEFNWVRHVSVELTGQMLATLFDVPQEDRLKPIDWSDTIQSLNDPEVFETPDEGFRKLFECLAYFQHYYEERKQQPPKFDLISLLAHDDATGEMGPQELLGNIMLRIVGGRSRNHSNWCGAATRLSRSLKAKREAVRESEVDSLLLICVSALEV